MKLEISVATPHGVPKDVDIHLVYEQIQKELDSLPEKATKTETPAKDNELGDISLITWVIHHFDLIVNSAATAAKLLQTINILSQALLPKKKAADEKKSSNTPQIAFTVKTDKGEVRIERRLPLSDDEMAELRKEMDALLDQTSSAGKRG